MKPCDLEKARSELATFELLKTAYERVAAGDLRLSAVTRGGGTIPLNERISEDDLYSIRTMAAEALRLQLNAQRDALAALGLDVSELSVPEPEEDDLQQLAATWG